ncbi:hypothetical protein VP496E541_P0105 [Vibrio phage 496E54-1]|nr:hypothetical protein VP495E541_P0106 [Vibrio phage 495E54-1]CAH9013572.1 hypothetical protein VP496E541_P0105 [Vibrio phage 496E54-1]
MKSSGICTNNENNRFEVEWTIDNTWWRKLFNLPTKFVYETTSVELKTDKYRSKNAGLYYDWFDKEGNKVVCNKTLDKISKTVNMFSKNSQEHSHWMEK